MSFPVREVSAETVQQHTSQCGQHCPCWRLVSDSVCKKAKGSSPYAIEIMRAGETPKGTYAKVCASTSQYSWNTRQVAKLPQCI